MPKSNESSKGLGKRGTGQDDNSSNPLDKEKDDNIVRSLFHIFFFILFLVLAFEVLSELTIYVLNESNEIITLAFGSILKSIQIYVMEFDPYSRTYHSMLLALCVFGLYFLIDIYNNIIKDKQNTGNKTNNGSSKIKEIALIVILYYSLCFLYIITKTRNKLIVFGIVFSIFYGFILCKYIIQKMFLNIPKDKSRKEIYVSLFILFLFLLILLYFLSFEFPYREDFTHIVFNFDVILFFEKLLLSLIVFTLICYIFKFFMGLSLMKIWRNIKEFIGRNPWNTGIFIYSLSLYIIICLFFVNVSIGTEIGIGIEAGTKTEIGTLSGVLILLGIAVLISGGLSMCGSVVNKAVNKNEKILRSLGVDISEEALMEKLRNHINELLLNFLISISSYIFLSALLKTFSPENVLLSDLNLILFIPLYLFFFRAGSTIAESIHRKLYELIEKKSKLTQDRKREDSFVKVFVTLTRLAIIIFVILHILDKFEVFWTIREFISTPPISYLIQIAIAVPITMQVLVLILDPLFEGEIIEMGSNIGKIKNVGFLFTKMETMKGEHVYIPNAELLARTIKRLNVRGPQDTDKKGGGSQDEGDKEKGVMVHFSCTLSYDYELERIKNLFEGVFKERDEEKKNEEKKNEEKKNEEERNRKNELEEHLEKIGCEGIEEQSKFIFSENSHPFVFIEDFKDHGIVYRFNFRVKNALYAPILRGFFMEEFKKKMNKDKKHIYTPLKHEIRDPDYREPFYREPSEDYGYH